MRWYYKVLIVAAVGWVAVELSAARQPPLGGLSGMGGKGTATPAQLISYDTVKKEHIDLIVTDSEGQLAELYKELQKDVGNGNLKGIEAVRDKMTAVNKDMKDRINSVLTADQKRNWQEMIGDEFKLDPTKIDPK